MKLIKHCHEVDLANLGIAQGALLGLVTDTRLEITHCFPFPSVSDETFSDEDFQVNKTVFCGSAKVLSTAFSRCDSILPLV